MVVDPTEMLPAVVNEPGDVVVQTNANITEPPTGGVMVAMFVVPLINVKNVVGAIVVVDAIVAGNGC